MTSHLKSRLLGLAIITATLIADQLSKAAILAEFTLNSGGRHISLTSFFDLVLWWNRGVSFGMLVHDYDYMPYILTGLSLVIAAALTVWLWRTPRLVQAAALALVIGGAIGNAIDRLQYGAVVDFLYFHIGEWYWPAFNVADAAICVGVVLMLILESRKPKTKDSIGNSPEIA